jgi:hypothetical protein
MMLHKAVKEGTRLSVMSNSAHEIFREDAKKGHNEGQDRGYS